MSSSKKTVPPERFLVLLRHGIAEERSDAKPDADRALTAKGHARMKSNARGLARALPKAEAVFTSPLLRAVQTALWVSRAYGSKVNVTTTDALAPGAGTRQLRALLASMDVRRAVLVGHEPDLGKWLRALTGQSLELKKGGCAGVRLSAQGATLEWVLPPRLLRKLA